MMLQQQTKRTSEPTIKGHNKEIYDMSFGREMDKLTGLTMDPKSGGAHAQECMR